MKIAVEIDEEFRNLIPPLKADEYTQLEQNIINDGCRDPLVIWNDTIIDGHNRFKICTDNDIEFKTESMEFDGREDVAVWMIRNQFARRNISSFVRAELALLLEPMLKVKAKENIIKRNQFVNIDKVADTRKEVAKEANISTGNIHKVKKILEKAPEEVKEKVRSGEVSINQAFKEAKSIELAEKKEVKKQEKIEARLDLQVMEPEYDDLIKHYTPKLIHGDTLKEMTKISAESIDLIVTDPPYNMDKAEWDSYGSAEEFADWMEIWLKECFRVLKPTGSIYVFGINRMLSHVQMRMEKIGFTYRNWIIWDTVQGAGGGLWVNRQEAILYFSKSEEVYEDKDSIKLYRSEENIREYKGKTYEFKNPSNIWRFPTVDDKAEDRTVHPTQKPVELIERIIKANSKEGDTILDCFMGSGSTGVAAMKNRRLSIGIEMDGTYINISKKRFDMVEI